MTVHDDEHRADGLNEMATWMCQERICKAMPAGGAILIFLMGTSKKAKLARLCQSMYGTRDGASIWKDTWSEVFKDGSMKVGVACSGFFGSQDGNLKGLCRGDDFCLVARGKQLKSLGMP